MAQTQITTEALPSFVGDDSADQNGAELVFHGRVRADEAGQQIAALFYEHYAGMAEDQLQQVADEAVRKFPISNLTCLHRVGTVPAGQASLRVVVHSRHRAEALTALGWFVTELKRRVPIWKWAVTAEGDRFPCAPCAGCQTAATDISERDSAALPAHSH